MHTRAMMSAFAACAAAAAGFLAVMVWASQADAGGRSWSRGGTLTGPHGRTASWHRSGHCGGGSCTTHRSFTGPEGRTWSRDAHTTYGGGHGHRDVTVTGPNGGTWSRSRSWSWSAY